jgi:hypothetical protein
MARGYGSPEGGHGEGDMGRALAALSPSIRDSMVVSTKVTPGQIDREAGGPRPVAAANPSKHRKELDAVKKMTRTEVGSALEAWGLPINGSLNDMRTRLKETLERAQAEAVAAARPPIAVSAREAVRLEAISLCLIRYTRSYSTIQPSI